MSTTVLTHRGRLSVDTQYSHTVLFFSYFLQGIYTDSMDRCGWPIVSNDLMAVYKAQSVRVSTAYTVQCYRQNGFTSPVTTPARRRR